MIKIKRTKTRFWEDLQEEECGSWEDHGHPEPGTKLEEYGGEHAYNILGRNPLKLHDREEWDTISRHCLENSIDKVAGNLDYYGACIPRQERMELMSWLRWLNWLKDKIDREAELLGWK